MENFRYLTIEIHQYLLQESVCTGDQSDLPCWFTINNIIFLKVQIVFLSWVVKPQLNHCTRWVVILYFFEEPTPPDTSYISTALNSNFKSYNNSMTCHTDKVLSVAPYSYVTTVCAYVWMCVCIPRWSKAPSRPSSLITLTHANSTHPPQTLGQQSNFFQTCVTDRLAATVTTVRVFNINLVATWLTFYTTHHAGGDGETLNKI